MSEITYPPKAEAKTETHPLDTEHPQYTPLSNDTAQSEWKNTSEAIDYLSGTYDWLSCADGSNRCAPDEATKNSVDLASGAFTQKRKVGDATVTNTAKFDPVLENERFGVSALGALGLGVDTDGAHHDLSELALQGSLSGEAAFTGTFEQLPNGDYRVTSGQAAQGAVAAGVAVVGGVNGSLSGGLSNAQVRIIDAATVEQMRGVVPNDALAAQLLLGDKPHSALEMLPGERTSGESFVRGSFGGSVQALGGGSIGVSGRFAAGFSVERTEQGLVFSATQKVKAGLEGSVTAGIKAVKTDASAGRGRSQEQMHSATVTLDPVADADLIRELEALPAPLLFLRLAEMTDRVSLASQTTDGESSHKDVSLSLVKYDNRTQGQITVSDEVTEATYRDVTDGKVLGRALMSDGLENTLQVDGDGLSFSSFDTGFGPGIDTDATADWASPVKTLLDFVTTETREQTLGRALDGGELDALVGLAETDSWDKAFPTGHGQALEWMDLKAALAKANGLPGPQRDAAIQAAFAGYAAGGGDLAAVDRICDSHELGHAEQWPVSIDQGATRMATLEAHVKAGPEALDLTEISLLRNQVSACEDFTLANAKVDMLERLQALHREASERLASENPDQAAELLLEQDYVDTGAGLQRCAAFAERESGLFTAGLGPNPNRKLEEIKMFYKDWKRARNDLRDTYRKLGIPEESWPITPKIVPGADRSPYEPDPIRTLHLLENTPGIDKQSFDFVTFFRQVTL